VISEDNLLTFRGIVLCGEAGKDYELKKFTHLFLEFHGACYSNERTVVFIRGLEL